MKLEPESESDGLHLVWNSNSFKKTQTLVLLPKIDDKMEQYAHAVEVSTHTHTHTVLWLALATWRLFFPKRWTVPLKCVAPRLRLMNLSDSYCLQPAEQQKAAHLPVLRSQIPAAPGRWHHSSVFSCRQIYDRNDGRSELFIFILPLPVFSFHLGRFTGWLTARWWPGVNATHSYLWRSFERKTGLTQRAVNSRSYRCEEEKYIVYTSHWGTVFTCSPVD